MPASRLFEEARSLAPLQIEGIHSPFLVKQGESCCGKSVVVVKPVGSSLPVLQ